MAPLVETFDSRMPGLSAHDLSRESGKSYALRSSHFIPSQESCPVPTLWLEQRPPAATSDKLDKEILEWLGSSDCCISRLIVAGASHHRPDSAAFISSILATLTQRSWQNSKIQHLVFYNCSLSIDEHWWRLAEIIAHRKCPLRTLVLAHAGVHVPSVIQILTQSNISELLIHGAPTKHGLSKSKKSFRNLLQVLDNQDSSLRRLSLTSCRLDDEDVKEICGLLRSPGCKLTALNLSANFFTEVGVQRLREALIDQGQMFSSSSLGRRSSVPLEMLSLCGSTLYVKDKAVTEAMAEFMESPNCGLKTLDLTGRVADSDWLSNLSQILQRSTCKIRSLYLFHKSHSSGRAPASEKLIDALKRNKWIINLQFPWATEAYQQIADSLLQRNLSLERLGLVNEQLVAPQCTKLFLCGHGRVGKTTLRNNLLKPSAIQHTYRRLWGHVMAERRITRGMKLCILPLPNGNSNIVICDLAGQREYHALHHFFMTSSNEDLFAVVCKYEEPAGGHQQDLTRFLMTLEYWLRFIVSHRTQIYPKPMVILLVNFFNCNKKKAEMSEIAKIVTRAAVAKYGDLLDFGPDASNVLGVQLNSCKPSRGTVPIMSMVENLTAKMLKSRNPIFKTCQDISSAIGEWKLISSRSDLIMTVSELLREYTAMCNADPRSYTAPSSFTVFEAALLELHKIGQIVFFKSAASARIHEQVVILDPVWFYGTLVGSFVEPMVRSLHPSISSSHNQLRPREGAWKEEEIKVKIMKLPGTFQDVYLDRILSCLENLELFFVVKSEKHGFRELLFPTALADEGSQASASWHPQTGNLAFFGRRLQCEDKDRSLIPWGVFAKLQVKLHAMYGDGEQYVYKVGYGWITFTKNEVDVLIRFGGANMSHWEDRHWIDIRVRFLSLPSTNQGSLELEAESIICKVRTIVLQICQGLDRGCSGFTLKEWVLLEDAAVLLSKMKEEVHLQGIQAHCLCNGFHDGASRLSTSAMSKLFLPAELKELSMQNAGAIKDLEDDFHLKDNGDGEDELSLINEKRLYELFTGNMRCEFASLMSKVVKELEDARKSIYARVWEQLLKGKVSGGGPDAIPLCPYLADEGGKWSKLKRMVQLKEVRMHLMCEWLGGCHRVEGQKGVKVTLSSPEWLARMVPVLIPGLKLVYGAAKIAATIFLPGSEAFLPGVTDLFSALGLPDKVRIERHDEAFPQILSAYLEDMNTSIPNVPNNLAQLQEGGLAPLPLLREFYKYTLEGRQSEVDMERDFSMHCVYYPATSRHMWVCRHHLDGGEVLAPANPFRFI